MSSSPISGAPAVSVLMAVHNNRPFIEAAVRSIMSQTLRDIEIVIVDDGSTDGTTDILRRLAAEDGRIRLEVMGANVRQPRALNHGLSLVRGPYVARMDGDDVSHPTRLAIQKRYMDLHPEVVALGGSLRRMKADGQVFATSVRPRDAFMCRWIMRFRLPIVNPTTMFRFPMPDGTRPAFDLRYNSSQDHDFYVRALPHGDIVCLPDIVLDYRHHGASISYVHGGEQRANSKRICLDFMEQELPAYVRAALEPAVAAFFDSERVPAKDVFEAYRAMLRHDVQQAPSYRAWLHRQTPQLAFDALRRAKYSKAQIALAFMGPGLDLVPPLAWRVAELANVLPRALTTRADVTGGTLSLPQGASRGSLEGVRHADGGVVQVQR